MKILILGVSGMLGHTLFYEYLCNREFDIYGTVRNLSDVKEFFPGKMLKKVISCADANDIDSIKKIITKLKPDIVINCIGIIKQLPISKEPVPVITINALFPHLVASICRENGCRLIHVSTDCVFDGKKGKYTEDDKLSAEDLYGISKFLGEVKYEHAVTIRTSIIGHGLSANYSLIDWFLSQSDSIKGFTNAIYTGFPTIEVANIIADYVIPNQKISGLYQVSSDPISKYDLLNIVAKIYGKSIRIVPYDDYHDDKSLISDRFRNEAGYNPPSWEILVKRMYDNYKKFGYIRNQ
jgi:dTDP-4-dehydrorhamnose reductase